MNCCWFVGVVIDGCATALSWAGHLLELAEPPRLEYTRGALSGVAALGGMAALGGVAALDGVAALGNVAVVGGEAVLSGVATFGAVVALGGDPTTDCGQGWGREEFPLLAASKCDLDLEFELVQEVGL
ncbi:hypothetical protein PR202_gn00454 [Eleusine coracana subsp. coracana]|uniref:Uncharacterized protein n=1 Tax=Eleusine coracana subsp. coracana TaxID=191504 RepID=A0AAV5FZR2_ELECO|nr:hypothetical protein PR202_gn00454 [Eleusine coracana subsp. coracana]